MRNAFIDELVERAEIDPNIVLIVGDLGYSVVEPFADRFPERFLNAGVAEQNMMGLAAGMSSEGCQVFVYSIGNFPTFRCAEQIRNDVDYHQLPVTIVSVGGGMAYGALGYSHHTVQDYALMRSFPNMLIAAPGDPMEVRACMRYLFANPQPSYLRLAKAGEPCFHLSVPKVEPGCWLPVDDLSKFDDDDKIILTTGGALGIAQDWLKTQQYSKHRIASLPLWGQAAKSIQGRQVAGVAHVETLEDHLADGGFGSWLLESIVNTDGLIQKVRTNALKSDICGMVGTQVVLNEIGGLMPIKNFEV